MALPSKLIGGRVARFLRWLVDDRGNVGAVMAVLLVPIVGALSMGVETSSWFLIGRNAQNAADSAAIAAANNVAVYGGTLTQAVAEGRANARRYGFTDGTNNVTVSIVDGQTCPDGKAACYKATVTKVVPMYMARIVGFSGDTTIGTQRAKTIKSVAYAEPVNGIKYPDCLTVTGSSPSGNGIQTKGNPFSNMAGCTIAALGSNTAVNCNGQGIGGGPSIFATGSISSACTTGVTRPSQSSSAYTDPYANYYQKIPCSINSVSTGCDSSQTVNCSPYAGTLAVGNCYSAPAGGGPIKIDSTTLNPTSPSVIYLYNTSIYLNDNAILSSTNVTFVFTGTSPGSITGGQKGGVDITAPSQATSDPWQGVAAYQDTHLNTSTTPVLWSSTGGTPTVDIVGLMYLPWTDVDFGGGAGAPLKTSTCYIAVYHSYSINGTGLSMQRSGCAAAGLNYLPTVTILRAALVK